LYDEVPLEYILLQFPPLTDSIDEWWLQNQVERWSWKRYGGCGWRWM